MPATISTFDQAIAVGVDLASVISVGDDDHAMWIVSGTTGRVYVMTSAGSEPFDAPFTMTFDTDPAADTPGNVTVVQPDPAVYAAVTIQVAREMDLELEGFSREEARKIAQAEAGRGVN